MTKLNNTDMFLEGPKQANTFHSASVKYFSSEGIQITIYASYIRIARHKTIEKINNELIEIRTCNFTQLNRYFG